MANQDRVARSVAVIGLGRFGGALALELEQGGTEVLGIDTDENAVNAMVGTLTHVVQADAAQEDTAADLALGDFDRVVVAIGGNIVASCLASSIALGQGAQVWAKAVSEAHARILRKLGVQHVVFPELEMGRRVAHLVRGGMVDYIEFDTDFAMVTTHAPTFLIGKPLGSSRLRSHHGVTVVAVKRADAGDGTFTYATAETVPGEGDLLIASGRIAAVERFSARG